MRLWTLHPRYLDARGLVALWREALLAQAVLRGRTRGYRNHPQLARFRAHPRPIAVIATYLRAVHAEAVARGYSFDAAKIARASVRSALIETDGQLLYEWAHLRRKLRRRDPKRLRSLSGLRHPDPHRLFVIRRGAVRDWERQAPVVRRSDSMQLPTIRNLPSGGFRLSSRTKNPKTGRRRNLGTSPLLPRPRNASTPPSSSSGADRSSANTLPPLEHRMIIGVHTIVSSTDPDKTRAFFRDVLGLNSVDAGRGWLIFGLPPAELAAHPDDTGGKHELYLMCDDVEATMAELAKKGVQFTRPVADRGWGLLTSMKLPGAGELWLYQPKHPMAIAPPKAAKKKPARASKPSSSRAAKKRAKRSPARRKR